MALTNAEKQRAFRERNRAIEAEALAGDMATVKIRPDDDDAGTFTVSMGARALADLDFLAREGDSTVSELLRAAIEGQMKLAVRARPVEAFRFLAV